MQNMKSFFLAVLFALPLAAWGQPAFRQEGKTLAELHAPEEDETVVSAEADINKDGIKDLVVALPGSYSGSNFAFYFGDSRGNYTLFRAYDIRMYGQKTGITVTDAGVVRIQCDGEDGADIFLFRWQDGDFRLIGGKKDRHASAHYDESYNYLTGKMIRTDGEGRDRKAVNGTLPKLPVINFGWIPLRYDMLDYLHTESEDGPLGPDDILVMGIFRMMQANEMLFWHFCDWENPSRNPGPDLEEGTRWYAEDAYESPGSYNCYSSLSFTKLDEGVFLIKYDSTSYSRAWEADINEDGSNIDELLEDFDEEEETTEEEWTFYDGMFTVG